MSGVGGSPNGNCPVDRRSSGIGHQNAPGMIGRDETTSTRPSNVLRDPRAHPVQPLPPPVPRDRPKLRT
ncbi:hypothetical protein MATL_G00173550 [Megalops atlanticus]|uniref:Uncharacterized protein n=1 Tax=Megalops atlanticus TaxID=7932 RepID=A0A9D3PTK8_MEGAT|nr:hypothetical protein MATL_G00173550 [Megalops atlanticus]